jgi:hypothetical protein
MTEADWVACEGAGEMLRHLRNRGSDRRRRLLVCALVRRAWGQLADGRGRRAVEVAELYADGGAKGAELSEAQRGAQAACWAMVDTDPHCRPARFALSAAYGASQAGPSCRQVESAARQANVSGGGRERAAQAGLVRDLFGDPFRAVAVGPARLTPAVAGVAAAAYEERTLPSGHLDPLRLSVLADALEEAGCSDPELLGHLRSAGPHVRGCWALDLILGKS